MYSPQLSRAARSLLDWSADDLATAAGVGVATVWRFEGGQNVREEKVGAMFKAFENAGLEFIPVAGKSLKGGAGLRLREQE